MTTRPEDVEAAKAHIEKRLNVVAFDADHTWLKVEVGSLRTILASHAELTEAAQAVVDRWDSPKWKDAEHTGVLIGRLRTLLPAAYVTDNQGEA